ncbi:hypothetical protein BOTBODRAFT_178953 [Botryobasidium botryosum FD-172 SS1]|uniref:Uncharacterized protein n=1 Tax=Botryobasidium botryosum (strain FD-172 SS1) TaxID=930990 RepID=A0A067M4C8_BOTB1|nr:hypothetical protein BOTBODRAFT_178953 [Botryobasidium botryosum FD-172 SS1]
MLGSSIARACADAAVPVDPQCVDRTKDAAEKPMRGQGFLLCKVLRNLVSISYVDLCTHIWPTETLRRIKPRAQLFQAIDTVKHVAIRAGRRARGRGLPHLRPICEERRERRFLAKDARGSGRHVPPTHRGDQARGTDTPDVSLEFNGRQFALKGSYQLILTWADHKLL